MDLARSAPLLTTYWPLAVAVGAVVVGHKVWKYLHERGVNLDLKRKKSVSFSEKVETLPQDSKYNISPEDEDADNFFVINEDVPHIPYKPNTYSDDVMIKRSLEFYECLNNRRSCRFFSDKPVPLEVIENIIRCAGTSPSGAHTEPWTFVVVSNQETKQRIREIIEEEEELNYRKRMGQQWLQDLAAVGTTWEKPYLEEAPYIVLVFKQVHGFSIDGARKTHYYSEISVSISVGLFIAAVQYSGLVTLTSTPMNAGPKLRSLLKRPVNEKVLVLLPVGYPADDATVPNFKRKPVDEIMVHI